MKYCCSFQPNKLQTIDIINTIQKYEFHMNGTQEWGGGGGGDRKRSSLLKIEPNSAEKEDLKASKSVLPVVYTVTYLSI